MNDEPTTNDRQRMTSVGWPCAAGDATQLDETMRDGWRSTNAARGTLPCGDMTRASIDQPFALPGCLPKTDFNDLIFVKTQRPEEFDAVPVIVTGVPQ